MLLVSSNVIYVLLIIILDWNIHDIMDGSLNNSFPGPCYACKTGNYRSVNDRAFMQHLRYCVEVERDKPAKRRRFSNERPRTSLRPDFMLQRLRPDDYEDTFCAGMLESRPTIDEMRHHKHTSSDPRSRECYTYSHEDQSRWELHDSDENEFARNNSVLPDCEIPVSKAPYQKNNSALPDNSMFQS